MPTFPSNIKLQVKDKASAAFKRISRSVEPLQRSFRNVNNSFKTFQTRTEGLRKGLSKAGAGMRSAGQTLSIGLTAPLTLLGKSAFDATLSFDKAMNNIRAKAKVTSKSFADLEAQALELGSTTQFSASEAAQAMGFLAQAGFDTEKIFQSIPGVLDLAAASGTDLARTADVASNIMGAFGLEAKEMGRVSDVLAATMAGSNVDMEQLADTMKFAAPVAKQFGLSLEQTSAAAGLLGNIGLQGTVAGTALKNAFLGLSAPTSEARKTLKDLGVAVVDNKGDLLDFTTIMANLGDALVELPQSSQLAVLKEVFGKIGISGAAELVKQAKSGALRDFTREMENADGAAKRMRETMQGGAVGSVTRLRSAFEGLMISIGKSGLIDAIASIAETMASLFGKLSKTNPGLLKMGTVIAAVVAALGPLLMMFGGAVSGISALITAFAMFKAVVITLAAAVSIPFLAILAAIAALSWAGFEVMRNWGAVKFFFLSMWDEITDSFDDAIDNIKRKIATFTSTLPDFLKEKFGIDGMELNIKSDEEKRAERAARASRRLAETEPGEMETKLNDIVAGVKSQFGLVETQSREVKESKVVIDIKNAPPGTKTDTSQLKDKNIGLNVGFQGGTL